jgi:diaminohydroxyphosphoribosylaminopyrimidine deaminase/5-amino-6-(5-phosphoribosylamino)uracil reductase
VSAVASVREVEAMRLAIALSARGLGTTSPNPPVGCVILDATAQIAGTGYHRRKGEPHAEWYALAQAGSRAAGGTAVVTLEPCNTSAVPRPAASCSSTPESPEWSSRSSTPPRAVTEAPPYCAPPA